jgi:beta-glucosidase/6-phospho-beta-glucosidase/beta-galactosidase
MLWAAGAVGVLLLLLWAWAPPQWGKSRAVKKLAPDEGQFVWGVSTSAYQIEGAHDKGGKSPSIWDTFVRQRDKIRYGQKGDNGTNHYYHWKEDVALMRSLGIQSYRFSISWPRLIPAGSCPRRNASKCTLNPEGLAFYHGLLDALLAARIRPYVTLYHWDLPQSLFHEYGGWANNRIVDDFSVYAEVVFREFSSKVSHWFTLNEPWVMCTFGYYSGTHAPGMRGFNPFACAHHALNAHAAAVNIFRSRYQKHGDSIGISLNAIWNEPFDKSAESEFPLCSL